MDKPYIVLARKYRPKNFDEVMGQEPVATTLKNAISLGRIGHAYLFTGPRGVGKTSMARILAKALNCKTGPTTEPCGKCQSCTDIDEARSLDVLEIDGASNRGIDEIRALRENVKFAPSQSKFKIYIIDEVHQITNDGFNALLKTLEEPPAHVKFIFATTASHKVPATILSRCQRFDFRRIPAETITQSLKDICKKEKIKIDEEALAAIAKAADGGLRDSQSILDQIAAMGRDKITKADVERSLGSPDEERLLELSEALAAQDARAAVMTLTTVLQEGKDPSQFVEKLIEHFRNLLFAVVSDKLLESIDTSDTYREALQAQKTKFTRDDLFYIFTVLTQTLQLIKRFEQKRIPIEMALIKLAHRAPSMDTSAILDALKSVQQIRMAPKTVGASAAKPPLPAAPVSAAAPGPIHSHKSKVSRASEDAGDDELPDPDVEISAADTGTDFISLDNVWNSLVRLIKQEKMSIGTYLAEGEPQGLFGTTARISFPERFAFHRETLELGENRRLIERHLSSILEKDVRVEFESVKELTGKNLGGSEPEAPSQKLDPDKDTSLKSAMNIFGGKIVP